MQPEDRAVFDRIKSNGRINHDLRKIITQCWCECSRCGRILNPRRPAFAGYDLENNPISVGSCCSHELKEFATPLYRDHEINIAVADKQPIWRYMDLAKFVALLSQKGIYFPRVDSLDDKFEGALGLASREADYDQFYLSYYRKLVVSPPPGYPIPDWSDEEIEKQAQRLLRETKDGGAHERNSLVSCWHANDSESEAQWRLYCPAMTVGIAIKSDVGRLWEAIRGEYMGVVGKIRYIDFRKEYAHNYRTVFFKRNSLSHEQEIRAVIPNHRKEPSIGRLVSCDIGSLVESITVSPFSPSWSLSIVESLVAKYGFSIKVGVSELTEKPFF